MQRRPLATQLAALLTATLLAAWVCTPPRHDSLSFEVLLLRALLSVLIVAAVPALAARFLYRDKPHRARRAIVVRAAARSAWLVPSFLLFYARSPWMALPAALLLVSVTRLIRLHRFPPPALPEPDPGPFATARTWPWFRKFVLALAAALCFQCGIVAAQWNRPNLAALLITLTIVTVTWRANAYMSRVPDRRRASAAILAAVLITAAALTEYLRPGGSSDVEAASNRRAFASGNGEKGPTAYSLDPAFRGVILWPEVQPHVTLVPPIHALKDNLFGPKKEHALDIPFAGVYWLYRFPDRKPPATSHVAHGNPSEISFRANDRLPLVMEARQNFGTMIDTACCSRIEIDITNADPYPGTIEVELLLLDTTQIRSRLSLGRAPVKTAPPQTEILSFKVPRIPAIRRFDEVSVVFHRARARATRSARISIERFRLIPRR